MKKGQKNPHTPEWNKKISEGVKRQHAEGRVNLVGFTDESRQKAYKITWKGDDVSYVGLHQWVARNKGRPRRCEVCGTTSAKKYEWANIDHRHRRVLEDFIRMCTSCHRNYDIKNNNYRDPHKQYDKK